MILWLMFLILLQGFYANQKDYQICVRKRVQFFFKAVVVVVLAPILLAKELFLQLA